MKIYMLFRSKYMKRSRSVIRVLLLTLILLLGTLCGICLQKKYIPRNVLNSTVPKILNNSSLSQSEKIISLKTRSFHQSQDPKKIDSELDSFYTYQKRKIPLSRLALICIDAWAAHPNDGLQKRMNENILSKLKPLVEALKRHNVLIIHTPYGRKIHEALLPTTYEIILDGPDSQKKLLQILKKKNIKYLLDRRNTLFE